MPGIIFLLLLSAIGRAENPGKLLSFSQKEQKISFACENATIELKAVLPDVVNVKLSPKEKSVSPEHYVVERTSWPKVELQIVSNADPIIMKSGNIIVKAFKNPFRLQFCDEDGNILLKEKDEGGMGWEDEKVSLVFKYTKDDFFYGLGELDQREREVPLELGGRKYEVWNWHFPPSRWIVPVLLNLRGYGLFINNYARAEIDLGTTDPDCFSYTAEGGMLDWYFIAGVNFKTILKSYVEITGYPLLPPRWAFGYLQCKYGYENRKEAETITRTFREKRIPCDCIILDLYWFKWEGDLDFDQEKWPEPKEMIEEFRKDGFKIIVIEQPNIVLKSKNYTEAKELGLFARTAEGGPYQFSFWAGGDASLLDFTNPSSRKWWKEKHKHLIELGIAGWWTDINEPESDQPDMVYYQGKSPTEVHNIQALLMHKSIYEAYQEYAPEERLFILSRSGWPGIQRYGAGLWSGDVGTTFPVLAKQVPVGLNTGLAGVPYWNTDVGGFHGHPTAELYTRWIQFGAFCPIFRAHGNHDPREPWMFGEEAEEIVTRYIKLRYQLIPYIYTYAWRAWKTGEPLMRPLIAEFPADPWVIDLGDEYLFGEEILVAPVTEKGAFSRTVYLPAGEWYDFWRGERCEGKQEIEVDTPLEIMPIFIRAGSIIPLAPEMQYSDEKPLDPLILNIYPASGGVDPAEGEARFELYEDDGQSNAYQQGAFSLTPLCCWMREGQVDISIGKCQGEFTGKLSARGYLLKLHGFKKPRQVVCKEKILPGLDSRKDFTEAEEGWWWEEGARISFIKIVSTSTSEEIKITVQ